jgi:hypothetical protein
MSRPLVWQLVWLLPSQFLKIWNCWPLFRCINPHFWISICLLLPIIESKIQKLCHSVVYFSLIPMISTHLCKWGHCGSPPKTEHEVRPLCCWGRSIFYTWATQFDSLFVLLTYNIQLIINKIKSIWELDVFTTRKNLCFVLGFSACPLHYFRKEGDFWHKKQHIHLLIETFDQVRDATSSH